MKRWTHHVEGYDVDGHQLRRPAHLQLLVNLQTGLVERVPGRVDLNELQFWVDVALLALVLQLQLELDLMDRPAAAAAAATARPFTRRRLGLL